jgi:flavin-dependent dehydrogenase
MKAGTMKPVHIIGGGLAGSEAAWQLARAGVPVVLHEVRPERGTDAHQTDGLAERGGAVEGVLEGAPGEPGRPAEDSFELPPDPLNR